MIKFFSNPQNLRPLNEQDSNNSRDRGSHWGRARVLDDFDDLDGDPLDIEFDDRSARNNNLDIEVEIEDSQDSDDSRAVTEGREISKLEFSTITYYQTLYSAFSYDNYVKGTLAFSQTSPGFYVSAFKVLLKTLGKGEIVHNKQFLLFPQCFLTIWKLSAIFLKFEIVTCKHFQFGIV